MYDMRNVTTLELEKMGQDFATREGGVYVDCDNVPIIGETICYVVNPWEATITYHLWKNGFIVIIDVLLSLMSYVCH
jgi:hypothetical protein